MILLLAVSNPPRVSGPCNVLVNVLDVPLKNAAETELLKVLLVPVMDDRNVDGLLNVFAAEEDVVLREVKEAEDVDVRIFDKLSGPAIVLVLDTLVKVRYDPVIWPWAVNVVPTLREVAIVHRCELCVPRKSFFPQHPPLLCM